jgi:ubiquinone/menaquinone biosynthesis C-methylase UbiE
MANEFRTLNSHSAEHFGDTRDYWWNLDFLELMGKRLSLDRVQNVLDVGCGVGHWGQLLAKVIAPSARVQGIDRDPLWVEKAAARAAARGLADRFDYRVAVAEKLPFADASFDLVTCQTVLIHMPDPGRVVDEMIRVARPGGLILAAEPNNVTGALMLDSVSFHDPVDEILVHVRLKLICERGRLRSARAAIQSGISSRASSPNEAFAASAPM